MNLKKGPGPFCRCPEVPRREPGPCCRPSKDGSDPLWARNGREVYYRPRTIVVVLNWFEELRRLVPIAGAR